MTRGNDDLFSEPEGCEVYKQVKNQPGFNDIRDECIRLWENYKGVEQRQYSKGFTKDFAQDFHGFFWEMYLFELLKGRCEIRPSGPDFYVDKSVLLEATVTSIGDEDKNLPMLIPYDEQSTDTPYMTNCDRVISRITGAFIKKAGNKNESSNNIDTLGKEKPVVIAINLPYKEANDCDLGNGLGVRALYGLAQNSFFVTEELEFQPVLSNHPRIKKTDQVVIPTTGFRNEENAHIAGVIIASVTPFNSTYNSPSLEFIHNPYALHPVSKGWFGIGSEYWIEEDKLLSSHF